jgi:hypothetical protein
VLMLARIWSILEVLQQRLGEFESCVDSLGHVLQEVKASFLGIVRELSWK